MEIPRRRRDVGVLRITDSLVGHAGRHRHEVRRAPLLRFARVAAAPGEVKGISGDKGGHQECDRGISALCLTREPFPGFVGPTSAGTFRASTRAERRMCKRLAGPAGAVWALDVCEFEGEWQHRVACAGYDRHVMCWNLASRVQAPLASVYCKQRLMDRDLMMTSDLEEEEEDDDEAMGFGEEESDDDDDGKLIGTIKFSLWCSGWRVEFILNRRP